MTKDELFKQKGQLVWSIEVAQAKLQEVNRQLIELENSVAKEESMLAMNGTESK